MPTGFKSDAIDGAVNLGFTDNLLNLLFEGRIFASEPTRGDVVVFRGDQNHSYRNPGRKKAIAFSVVALAPG